MQNSSNNTTQGGEGAFGTLYIVSTPIGNLDDITARAVKVLGDVSVIAAEDTRHSSRLLDQLGLQKFLLSYHDHNEQGRGADLLRRLQSGESVALISDAGTPLVSDPGYRLVKSAQEAGIKVVPIPGASAMLAALVVSGLPSDRFSFEGFAPAKGAAREQFLQRVGAASCTSILYEAPHRILSLLESCQQLFEANREVVLCRELTKRFETVLRGTPTQLLDVVRNDSDQQRGEMVLLVSPAPAQVVDDLQLEKLGRLLIQELPVSRAAKVLAAWSGGKRADIYQLLEQWADKAQ
ncbi:MAG: 16S rRNA (cytidine(1402)-2'-O)-methyltransferase [Alcanivoracaceae bacterium]|nr:16S rRNA (cytidine(1402)-2'-O)-methyltransferase [Alcanivoracaceae bacterium]